MKNPNIINTVDTDLAEECPVAFCDVAGTLFPLKPHTLMNMQ